MKPHIKVGLFVGLGSLVVTLCTATLFGICGPVVTMLAGGLAGFLAVRQGTAADKSDAAKMGAISGAISGGLAAIGQVIASIIALIFVQSTGTYSFGSMPSTETETVVYYLAGAGTGLCFGIVGVALAAGAGALIAYLAAPAPASYPYPPQPPYTPPAQY